jgi:hypothetical protein
MLNSLHLVFIYFFHMLTTVITNNVQYNIKISIFDDKVF